MSTAESIGGYDGGRSGQPMASIKKHCKEPSRSLCHEWTSALDITNELHRLRAAVNEYSLNRIWFRAHARIDGTVVMIATPEIRWVSQMIFHNVTPTLWMIVMHSIYYRKLCGLSLAVLIPPILNMRLSGLAVRN